MVDFVKAFEEGKEAAFKAENARKEIDGVFNDLNEQLNGSTRGKIRIVREQLIEGEDGIFMVHTYPPRYYQAILAINPTIKKSSKKELARWEPSQIGYPVRISWSNVDRSCQDKIALENCLVDVIKDPINAEKMLILIQLTNEPDEVEKK